MSTGIQLMELWALFALAFGLLFLAEVSALLLYATPLGVFAHGPPREAIGTGLRGVLRN